MGKWIAYCMRSLEVFVGEIGEHITGAHGPQIHKKAWATKRDKRAAQIRACN